MFRTIHVLSTPVLSYTKNRHVHPSKLIKYNPQLQNSGRDPCSPKWESYPGSLSVSAASDSSSRSSSDESSAHLGLGTRARALSAKSATRNAIPLKSRGACLQSRRTSRGRSSHPASLTPVSSRSRSIRTDSRAPSASRRCTGPRPGKAGTATSPRRATCPGGGRGPTSASQPIVSYYISYIYHPQHQTERNNLKKTYHLAPMPVQLDGVHLDPPYNPCPCTDSPPAPVAAEATACTTHL